MKEQVAQSFDRHNVVFLLLCLVGLTAIYFIGIFPLHSEANNLQKKIQELKIATQEQAQIQSMLSSIDNEYIMHSNGAPLPEILITPLLQGQTDQILPDFEKIAAMSTMIVINVSPQLKKTTKLNQLVISGRLQGEFQNIRSFLYDLLKLSYVSQINTIELKSAGELLECNLTYSVSLT